MWQKVSDIEIQLGHSNIYDIALKRIKKFCDKKTKNITKEEKQRDKAFFEGETGIFLNEKLTRDITERCKRCKLPEAVELTKKLGYNRNNIMVREETSIAEKIIKLMKEIIKIMTQMMKKKKNHV